MPSTEAQVRRALCAVDNLRSDGPTLGRASAPATLTGYLRLDQMTLDPLISNELPPIIARYVRAGRLKIQLRTLATGNPTTDDSWALAKVAQGAGLLADKFWEALAIVGPTYIGAYQDDDGVDLARQLGANAKALETAAENPRVLKAIDRANQLAKAEGLKSGDFVLRAGADTERIRYRGPGTLVAAVRDALGPQRRRPAPCSRQFPVATRSPIDEPDVVPALGAGSTATTSRDSKPPARLRPRPTQQSRPRRVKPTTPSPIPATARPAPTGPDTTPPPTAVAPPVTVPPESKLTIRPRPQAVQGAEPKPSAPSNQPGRQPPSS